MSEARARFTSVIFDLDGTLVDSRPGIEESLCAAAAEHGRTLARDAIRIHIGPPIREILRRVAPGLADHVIDAIVGSYRKLYDSGGCLAAQLFPGVPEVLQNLRTLSTRCFVVTNKPALPAKLLLEHLQIAGFFEAVATPDDAVSPFSSKAEAVTALIRGKQLDASTACIVGDALDDADAAHANNVLFIAAAYGYGEVHQQTRFPVAHVARQPLDLLNLLANAQPSD